ncbi:MAG: BrnA antitoxin family protein [Betaproteobacteria bacterium]|nr:BrnA antitoxin family protein [Betaproteobacteria bacterium]
MSELTPHPDPEMNGEYARVTTPEDILARRRGRPVGSVKENRKVQTAIRFDPEVLAALKSTGRGWQTRVNEVMKEWVAKHVTG